MDQEDAPEGDEPPPRVAMSPLALVGYVIGAGLFVLFAVARTIRELPRRIAALARSFARSFTCWTCGTPLGRGDTTCPACHVELPAPLLYERYVVPGRRYDAACTRCHTPYRLDEYRTGVAWTCPACKAPITERSAPPRP